MKDIKNIYKQTNSLEDRKDESSRILQKYKNKIPIIVSIDPSIGDLKKDYFKYLISGDLEGMYILRLIRSKIVIAKEKGLFCLTEKGGMMLTNSMNFYDIYRQYRDEDGFLYLNILLENTFG